MTFLSAHFGNVKLRYTLLAFIAFQIVVILATMFFHTKFYSDAGATVYDLDFGIGNLLHNLATGHGYKTTGWYIDGDLYTSRLPVQPLILFVISKINDSIGFVWIVKDIAVFSLTFFFVHYLLKRANVRLDIAIAVLAILMAALVCSRSIPFGLDYEEGYAIHFMIGLFAGFFTVNPWLFGVCAAALYMTKSTYALFVIVVTIYFAFATFRMLRYRAFVPLLMVCACYAGWLAFAKAHSDFTPSPLMMSSLNVHNLFLGTHPDLSKIYPELDNDLLPQYFDLEPKEPLPTEGAFVTYFGRLARADIVNNKLNVIVGAFRNFVILNFDPRKLGAFPEPVTDLATDLARVSNPFDVLRFLQVLLLNGALVFAALQVWRRRQWLSTEVFFLLVYTTSMVPHIIGGVEHRHVQPLIMLAALYLCGHLINRNADPAQPPIGARLP